MLSELYARHNLAGSWGVVAACAADASADVAEAVGDGAIRSELGRLERVAGVAQARKSTTVEDVEEVRAYLEPGALLKRKHLAEAHLFIRIARVAIVGVVGLGGAVLT